MESSGRDGETWQLRDGHRLLQTGGLLFLLGLLVGFGVPRFTLPRLALSTHLLGISQGTFLVAGGLLWPRLQLARGASALGRVLAIYGCLAAWTANLLGAIVGAGASSMPMATGGTLGSAGEELAIRLLLRSGAVALVGVALLILWGLRTLPRKEGER